MARLRGDADYGLAVVGQPIATLTPGELADRAAVAAPQAMSHLLDR